MNQSGARKVFTCKTVFDFAAGYMPAVFYMTRDARFCFIGVIASASGTGIFHPYICHAEAAIHSAGRDQK
jgi:hypothetical protein